MSQTGRKELEPQQNELQSGKLDKAIECLWLLIIFLVPIYFNPLCLDVFYFAKSILFQFLSLLMLGLVLAQWFLTGRQGRDRGLFESIKESPLQTAAAIFGLLWVVSTVFSIMPYRSLWGSVVWRNGLLSAICWIIFFLTIAQKMRSRRQVFRALYTLLASTGLLSLLGILQYINPQIIPWGSYAGRVFSADGNPLSLSAVLAMALPLTVAMTILSWYGSPSQRKSIARFILLLVLFAAQLTCLALAQYSITILLFIIGLLVFFMLAGVYLKRWVTVSLSVASLLLLIAVAGFLVGPMMGSDYAQQAAEPRNVSTPMAEQVGLPSLSIRIQIWKCAGEVVLQSPEIPFSQDNLHILRRAVGYGPETFIAVSQARFPSALKSDYTFKSAVIAQPENHYLYLGVTNGILGLLAFLAMLAIFFYLGFRLLARRSDREVVLIAAALVAAVAQYSAHIFFNPAVVTTDLVFWLMLGLAVALTRMEACGESSADQPASAAGIPHKSTLIKSSMVRTTIAAATVFLSVLIAINLLLFPLLANIKQKSAFDPANRNSGRFFTAMTESVNLQPEEAYYYGNLAYYAYRSAIAAGDRNEKSMLLAISEAAYNGGRVTEPYLAYWCYVLADNYLYHYRNGLENRLADALQLYDRADGLFPANAVILNKWSLALMEQGNLEEAGRKLQESESSDPLWAETSFYQGLLKSYQGNDAAAAELMVGPVRSKLTDLGFYIDFCGYTSLYGGIEHIGKALDLYASSNNDWLVYAMAGISDVFGNRLEDASVAFRQSAQAVTPQNINLLRDIVITMGKERAGFQATASEIAAEMTGKSSQMR